MFVSPEIEDDVEIELDMSKVRIDTTEQVVLEVNMLIRLTQQLGSHEHRLVVQCQSQRYHQIKTEQ